MEDKRLKGLNEEIEILKTDVKYNLVKNIICIGLIVLIFYGLITHSTGWDIELTLEWIYFGIPLWYLIWLEIQTTINSIKKLHEKSKKRVTFK